MSINIVVVSGNINFILFKLIVVARARSVRVDRAELDQALAEEEQLQQQTEIEPAHHSPPQQSIMPGSAAPSLPTPVPKLPAQVSSPTASPPSVSFRGQPNPAPVSPLSPPMSRAMGSLPTAPPGVRPLSQSVSGPIPLPNPRNVVPPAGRKTGPPHPTLATTGKHSFLLLLPYSY